MPRDQGYRRGSGTLLLVLSYVLDWLVLVALAVVGYFIGDMTPNQRPFSLEDRDISLPFRGDTVSVTNVALCSVLAPVVIIAIIALVFVPGSTVHVSTPKSLIWRRKLWELHAGLLGLLLSVCSAWFITNGMKNLFGKPRPNLLARCKPDLANLSQYIIGGIANISSNGQLVSGAICRNPDKAMIDEGFRAFPSGHSSISAAGLIYLSLFIASKFTVAPPFFAPEAYADIASTAFPSRGRRAYNIGAGDQCELRNRSCQNKATSNPAETCHNSAVQNNSYVSTFRRRAAAPPLYLLLIAVVPFFASVFISITRWYDFQHHGFDILFAFFMGMAIAFFSFRYYHLPISQGAGWAWGPRSHGKAFWSGVGSTSYSTVKYPAAAYTRPRDEEEARETT